MKQPVFSGYMKQKELLQPRNIDREGPSNDWMQAEEHTVLIRAKETQDYTASRNIWQLKVFVLLFHIESSLLLAWELKYKYG